MEMRVEPEPGELRQVPLGVLDERLIRYRLQSPQAERRMARSLERYGQLAPLVVCPQQETLVLVDGFKRLHAARTLKGMTHLSVRPLELDASGAKAAIYTLNRHGSVPQELEEAWIVHALVREDGLQQVEAARLLGRHKSWVNRRLAMLERLAQEAVAELRLGLLTPSLARQLVRLPMGNQAEALQSARNSCLTSVELRGVVDLLLSSGTAEQKQFVLEDPRRALRQAQPNYVIAWDPRLSTAGNRAARQLAQLLDGLAKMHTWLRYQGRSVLAACDREPLLPGFQRLEQETKNVTEAVGDFWKELQQP